MQATRTAIFIWALVLYGSVFLSAGTVTAQLESWLQGGPTAPISYDDLSGPGYDSVYDNAAPRDFETSQLANNLLEDEGSESWNPQAVQGGRKSASALSDGDSGGGAGDLSSQILDPTKPLYQLQFQYTLGSSLYGNESTFNSFQFQPVIPHKSFGFTQIVRATLSYRTCLPSGKFGVGEIGMNRTKSGHHGSAAHQRRMSDLQDSLEDCRTAASTNQVAGATPRKSGARRQTSSSTFSQETQG